MTAISGANGQGRVGVHLLLGIGVALWLNSGTAELLFSSISGSAKWATAAAWLGLALFSPGFVKGLVERGWPLALFGAYMMLMSDWGASEELAYLQNMAYLFLAYCLFTYYRDSRRRRPRMILVAVILIDLVIVAFRTSAELDVNPEISRYLATGNTYADILTLTQGIWGIGGYTYAYALPPILMVFLHWALRYRRLRWLSWIAVIAGSLLLVRMSYSIAVLLWIGCLVLVVIGRVFDEHKGMAITLVAIVGSAFTVLLGGRVLKALGEVDAIPEVMAVRIHELAALLSGGGGSQTALGARGDLYQASFQQFWNGVLGSAGAGRGVADIGGHSTWLDMVAVYGLFTLFFFWFLLRCYRDQMVHASPQDHAVLGACWVYFAVLGVLNPLLYAHILLIWLVFIPFLLDVRNDYRPKTQLVRKEALDHARPVDN